MSCNINTLLKHWKLNGKRPEQYVNTIRTQCHTPQLHKHNALTYNNALPILLLPSKYVQCAKSIEKYNYLLPSSGHIRELQNTEFEAYH